MIIHQVCSEGRSAPVSDIQDRLRTDLGATGAAPETGRFGRSAPRSRQLFLYPGPRSLRAGGTRT